MGEIFFYDDFHQLHERRNNQDIGNYLEHRHEVVPGRETEKVAFTAHEQVGIHRVGGGAGHGHDEDHRQPHADGAGGFL